MLDDLIVPLCQVNGCKEAAQIVSKIGDDKTYMKTCRRHDYTELPIEQARKELEKNQERENETTI